MFPIQPPQTSPAKGSAALTLARNVGILSGVVDPGGALSWVCEYDAITLVEIARGAPKSGPEGRLPAVTPQALTPSTMNTFGPDTKAAAYLTGANELLAEFTGSVKRVLALIDDANRSRDGLVIAPVVMLAAWAVAVLSGYRSYPLLFVNAMKARAIQRVLAEGWLVAVPGDLEAANSEYGGKRARTFEGNRAPTRFAALDDTLAGAAAEWLRPELSPDISSLVDSVATALGRLLLRIGGPHEGEPAIVWAYETRPGRRAIDVDLPPLRILKSFIGEQSGAHLPRPEPSPDAIVPNFPDAATWELTAPEDRRLLVEIYTVVLRWLRDDSVYGEESDIGRSAMDALERLTEMADASLASDDVVRLDSAMAAATARLRHEVRGDASVAFDSVVDVLTVVRSRLDAGSDDTGALMDILARGAVALNRARQGGKLRVDRQVLEEQITLSWQSFNLALASAVQLTPGPSAAGYHLHNYAGYLGSRDDLSSLRTAVDLYRRYVIPSRKAANAVASRGNTLRLSFQVAARSAVKLAEKLAASPEPGDALAVAELAVEWAGGALRTASAAAILDEEKRPVEGNVLFAGAVSAALAGAAALGVAIPLSDLELLERAVARSHAWIGSGEGRSQERVDADALLDDRVATVRAAARG